jgi:beta-glucosidase
VPALLDAGFPGQEGGHAIASILFGDINPSGKLTDTFGARREGYPDYGHYPGANGHVDYTEGVFVGYRHFDRAGIKPIFPFGYGLSYTRFGYSDLKLAASSIHPDGTEQVSLSVKNSGKRAGAEVVELYMRPLQPTIDRPVRELKGFERVSLQPGESRTVTFTLVPRDLAYFDEAGKQWKADAGRYAVDIGSSSRDIRLSAPFDLADTWTEPIR